jgi:hypothetical protein
MWIFLWIAIFLLYLALVEGRLAEKCLICDTESAMSQRRGSGITVESAARRGGGVLAREMLSADVEQYDSINDAALAQGLRSLEEGGTEIWYAKSSRDLGMG